MRNSVYKINKGINRPIEFRGLKAQYISYLAIGVLLLLILFVILYITGVNLYTCLGITLCLGAVLFMVLYKINDTYGQYGLQKKFARRNIPSCITVRSRKIFKTLASTSNH